MLESVSMPVCKNASVGQQVAEGEYRCSGDGVDRGVGGAAGGDAGAGGALAGDPSIADGPGDSHRNLPHRVVNLLHTGLTVTREPLHLNRCTETKTSVHAPVLGW